jgi:hypothetical protein
MSRRDHTSRENSEKHQLWPTTNGEKLSDYSIKHLSGRYDMELEKAYEILDIDENHSQEEIEERFRELTHKTHPDVNGSEEKFEELVKARDTAIDNTSKNNIKKYSNKGQERQLPIEYQQRRQETESTIEQIRRKQTSKNRRRLQRLKIFGGLSVIFSGGLTAYQFLSSSLQSRILQPTLPPNVTPLLFITTISLITVFGIFYWLELVRVRNTELAITEAEEALDQKANIVRVLKEIPIQSNKSTISEQELEVVFQEWVNESSEGEQNQPNLYEFLITESQFSGIFGVMPEHLDLQMIALQIGVADFSRIFLRKGIEKDIIQEKIGDKWSVQYEIII